MNIECVYVQRCITNTYVCIYVSVCMVCVVYRWSLGVIMFECLIGYTPFYADDPALTHRKIMNHTRALRIPPNTMSAEAADLIGRLICDASTRITFDEMTRHPFFHGFDWDNCRAQPGPFKP